MAQISDQICDHRTVLQHILDKNSNNECLDKTNRAVNSSGCGSGFMLGSDPDPKLCEGALT